MQVLLNFHGNWQYLFQGLASLKIKLSAKVIYELQSAIKIRRQRH